MMTQAKLIRGVGRWPAILDPEALPSAMATAGNRLADFAKAGDWSEVFMTLDDENQWVVPYQWRPGGKRWFSVLHQAAWHGASLQVVDKLIKRGALRRLRDVKGRIPFDVAAERGHLHLLKRLEPPKPPNDTDHFQQMDMRLEELIYGGLCPLLIDEVGQTGVAGRQPAWPTKLRLPSVEVLAEFRKQEVWFPMIGIDAGFRVSLRQGFLEVIMWNNQLKGSGLAHVVTTNDIIPVDCGFM